MGISLYLLGKTYAEKIKYRSVCYYCGNNLKNMYNCFDVMDFQKKGDRPFSSSDVRLSMSSSLVS